MNTPIKIGTRGSALALWQANQVQHLLETAGFAAEQVIITTQGDSIQDRALHELGGIGVFTRALDEAMLEGRIDLAVHSSKDIPSVFPDELTIAAFLRREDPRDVLLAVNPEVHFENFTRPLVIGTSSMRRRALLRHYFPALEVRDIRGNVDSRIARLEAGEYDGILLALAGVRRLGLERYVVQRLNPHSFTPPVGQGAVAVTTRTDSPWYSAVRPILNHPETEYALLCERAFLRTVQGGCSTPVFGLATVTGESVSFHCGVATPDGTRIWRHSAEGTRDTAASMGQEAATTLLSKIDVPFDQLNLFI